MYRIVLAEKNAYPGYEADGIDFIEGGEEEEMMSRQFTEVSDADELFSFLYSGGLTIYLTIVYA